MRIFLGCLLLILSTLSGVLLSQKYTDRLVFFREFESFNKKLKNEVSYSQSTIKGVLKKGEKNDFNDAVYGYIFGGDGKIQPKYLNSDEINFVNEYFSLIGKSDVYSQMKYLESMESAISEKAKDCEKEKNKYKSLYVKLGFLFGIILFILVI